MSTPTKSIEKLSQDQEFMAKSQTQLFENLNIVVENLKHKSDQQNLLVKNQNLIIRNQEIIVDNQINIIKNLHQIADNQANLLFIANALGLILNLLKKIDGQAEELQETQKFLEHLSHQIQANNPGKSLSDYKNL